MSSLVDLNSRSSSLAFQITSPHLFTLGPNLPASLALFLKLGFNIQVNVNAQNVNVYIDLPED